MKKLFRKLRDLVSSRTKLRKFHQQKFWYVLYEDGTIDGGLIYFDTAFWLAQLRQRNGRRNFQIVYWRLKDFLNHLKNNSKVN